MGKNVLIINGSPRISGNTERLSDSLSRGAIESGHSVSKLNLRELTINACKACFMCQAQKGDPCVQKDDMKQVYTAFKEADVVVWASPLYWMHFTSTIKTVIDRLFALSAYNVGQKETALIITSATPDQEIYKLIIPYYETSLVANLNWTNRGMILAGGVNNLDDVSKTDFIQKAYELGKSL